jgi:hypothetical protein
MISVRRSSLCCALVTFCSYKERFFGVCTLLQTRLQRNGAKGFLRATNAMSLGAMPFVVEALRWTTVAVAVVFVMYMLVRRWL